MKPNSNAMKKYKMQLIKLLKGKTSSDKNTGNSMKMKEI